LPFALLVTFGMTQVLKTVTVKQAAWHFGCSFVLFLGAPIVIATIIGFGCLFGSVFFDAQQAIQLNQQFADAANQAQNTTTSDPNANPPAKSDDNSFITSAATRLYQIGVTVLMDILAGAVYFLFFLTTMSIFKLVDCAGNNDYRSLTTSIDA